MPRSWHSATSYLNLSDTGSPHISQWSTRFSFAQPQSGQVCRGAFGFWEIVFFPHLHSQLPMVNSTNSSEQVWRKSEIGKIDLKTACNPVSSRSAGAV